MYYVLFLPALAVIVVAGYRLFRLRRHDRVLDRFWTVRRNVIQVLQENRDSIDPETYAEVRKLIAFLDDKIENYEDRKQDLFNLRKADLSAEDIEEALEFIDVEEEKPDDLNSLYVQITLSMGAAFYAYTPFTVLIPVALFILLLAGFGVHMAKKLTRIVYHYAEMLLREEPFRRRMRPTMGM